MLRRSNAGADQELAKEVLVMQRDPEVAESDLEAKRAEMKKLYDAHVKKYGNFLKTEVRNGRLWGHPHIEKILLDMLGR